MPTKLKRPSILKRLAITGVLISAQVYLFYSAVGGNFGIESQRIMDGRLIELSAQEAGLDAEIARYRGRIALLDPNRLDPDILTERARALLHMANPADILIPLPAE